MIIKGREGDTEMNSYKVLKGQAGNRIIIRHKEIDRPLTCTSHYANVEEFLRIKKNIEWYQIDNGKKINWKESK